VNRGFGITANTSGGYQATGLSRSHEGTARQRPNRSSADSSLRLATLDVSKSVEVAVKRRHGHVQFSSGRCKVGVGEVDVVMSMTPQGTVVWPLSVMVDCAMYSRFPYSQPLPQVDSLLLIDFLTTHAASECSAVSPLQSEHHKRPLLAVLCLLCIFSVFSVSSVA
jgi:hypothetical protein